MKRFVLSLVHFLAFQFVCCVGGVMLSSALLLLFVVCDDAVLPFFSSIFDMQFPAYKLILATGL